MPKRWHDSHFRIPLLHSAMLNIKMLPGPPVPAPQEVRDPSGPPPSDSKLCQPCRAHTNTSQVPSNFAQPQEKVPGNSNDQCESRHYFPFSAPEISKTPSIPPKIGPRETHHSHTSPYAPPYPPSYVDDPASDPQPSRRIACFPGPASRAGGPLCRGRLLQYHGLASTHSLSYAKAYITEGRMPDWLLERLERT